MSTVMTTNSGSPIDLADELNELLSGLTITGDRKELINKLQEFIETKSNREPKFLVGDGEYCFIRYIYLLPYLILLFPDSDSIKFNPATPLADDTGSQILPEQDSNVLDQEDVELLELMKVGKVKHRELERKVAPMRAVKLRRKFLEHEASVNLESLPCEDYDYRLVGVFT